MGLGGPQQYILDLLSERGPMTDMELALEIIGNRGLPADAVPFTTELEGQGRIRKAGSRWQITDDGERARKEP